MLADKILGSALLWAQGFAWVAVKQRGFVDTYRAGHAACPSASADLRKFIHH